MYNVTLNKVVIQGSVVRRPDNAIHWIAIFFNLRKIGS